MSENGKSYDFTDEEIKKIALLFRKYQTEIPDSLENFNHFLTEYIYNIMTIDEADNFFL